jgi:acetyltransferase-like isoleucine patch superfamily enzyme
MRKIFEIIWESLLKVFLSGVDYAKYKGVVIGNDCRVYTTRFGSEPWLIKIGSKVTITSGVTFLTHDGSTWLMNDKKGRRYLYRRIEIGDNVFVGVNAIIMPGVKIENNVIIAAGSVVTKSVPSGKIVGGNPARIIGEYSTLEKKVLLEYTSEFDLNKSLGYKQKIEKVVEKSFKNYME